MRFKGFSSNVALLQLLFTILFKFFPTRFGHTTIFMGNKYITNCHDWDEVQGFPSNATLLQ
jgi:hypothetical protein